MSNGQKFENLLMKVENEYLITGEHPVEVMALDNHIAHIHFHKELLENTKFMRKRKIVKRALDHIDEHMKILRSLSPLLKLVSESFNDDVIDYYTNKEKK